MQFSCSKENYRAYKASASDSLASDDAKLLLINYVPLGVTYEKVKAALPRRVNSRGKKWVIQEIWTFRGIDKCQYSEQKRILEFNFEYDKLYSYYFFLKDLDSVEAGELYANLLEFYASHFGQYDESVASDPAGFRAESSFWTLDEFSVALTNNIYASSCILSWGYQIRRPWGTAANTQSTTLEGSRFWGFIWKSLWLGWTCKTLNYDMCDIETKKKRRTFSTSSLHFVPLDHVALSLRYASFGAYNSNYTKTRCTSVSQIGFANFV